MKLIVAQFALDIHHDEHDAGHADRKSENVDECIAAESPKIAECNFDVILDHSCIVLTPGALRYDVAYCNDG